MPEHFESDIKESPTGDVKYDEEALRQAAERMHATGTGHVDDPDPTGGHDPKALKDAEEKMNIKED